MKKFFLLVLSSILLTACKSDNTEQFLGVWIADHEHSSMFYDSVSNIVMEIKPNDKTSDQGRVLVNVRTLTESKRNNQPNSFLKDRVTEQESWHLFYVVGDYLTRHSPDDHKYIQIENGKLKGLREWAEMGIYTDAIYTTKK